MDNTPINQHLKNMSIMLQMETLTFEAESVAYAVSAYYGLDTSDYSFGYIAGWSEGKELKEITRSLDVIRRTADEIIDKLDRHLMNQHLNEMAEYTFGYGAGYMAVTKESDGYSCKVYDAAMHEVDHAHVVGNNITMSEAIPLLCFMTNSAESSLRPLNQDSLNLSLEESEKDNNLSATESTKPEVRHKHRI